MSEPKIGVAFTICDGPLGDEKHFSRFEAELERLGFPFAVNFDHCSIATKQRFGKHPLCIGSHANDDPQNKFGEHHRQPALEILLEEGFEWMFQMDVDETLEHRAPERIREFTTLGADVVVVRCLDLWGDGKPPLYYRTDGPLQGSQREKLFNLRVDPKIHYYHPTVHAPRLRPSGREPTLLKRYDFCILHWGLMTQEDVIFHCDRWDRIYKNHVGRNPYGFYEYLRDPAANPPRLELVPAEALPPKEGDGR